MIEVDGQPFPQVWRRDPWEVTPFAGAVLGSEFLVEQWLGRYLAQMGLAGAVVVAACTPRVPTFTSCDDAHEGQAARLVLVFQCDGKNWHWVRPDPQLAHAVELPDGLEFPETLQITGVVGEPQLVQGYEDLGPLMEVCVRGAEGSSCGVFVPALDLGR